MWQLYKAGIAIVGKQVRVAGLPVNSVSVTNVANGRLARVAAGLVGACSSIDPQSARISFRKSDSSNVYVWSKCTGLVHDNSVTGVLVVDVSISNLERFEVGGSVART